VGRRGPRSKAASRLNDCAEAAVGLSPMATQTAKAMTRLTMGLLWIGRRVYLARSPAANSPRPPRQPRKNALATSSVSVFGSHAAATGGN
jgi:hypothetical protein